VKQALAYQPVSAHFLWAANGAPDAFGWVEADAQGQPVVVVNEASIERSVPESYRQQIVDSIRNVHEPKHISDALLANPAFFKSRPATGGVLTFKNDRVAAIYEIRAYVAELNGLRANGAGGLMFVIAYFKFVSLLTLEREGYDFK